MTIINTDRDKWTVVHTSGRKRGSPGVVIRKAPRKYQAIDRQGHPVGPISTSVTKAARHLTKNRKQCTCPTP